MSKLGDAFKDGRIVGGIVLVGVIGTFGIVGASAVAIDGAQSAAVVQTETPALVIDGTTDNGLAAEQEADAAAVEAARVEAARVEAERVAAEAAAAEAARIAAEQAAQAEAERVAAEDEVTYDEPAAPAAPAPVESGIPAGAWPLAWVADPNAADGGYWNFGACATSASTINGQPYCIP